MTLGYSLDTSALVEPWVRHYPHEVFPAFWDNLDKLVHAGRAACIDEVRVELAKKDDDLLAWVTAREALFQDLDDDVQRATAAILAHPEYRKLAANAIGRDRADAFVIGLAQVRGATVVTYEKSASKKVKIPDVCNGLRVPCISMVELMRREGWKFR